MGAETFMVRVRGKTAADAFNSAIRDAQHECGHGGYTGTIAEKQSFVMIPVDKGVDPLKFADDMLFDGDARVDDKWGPAGCIDLENGMFLFFGWASS